MYEASHYLWCTSYHLHPSFASRVRWGCAIPATTSSCRSHLAFDGGVLYQRPPPPVVRVSRSMGVCCPSHHLHPSFASRVRWGCAAPATISTRHSRLAFNGGALYQPPPPSIFRVSRSMGCLLPQLNRVSRSMGGAFPAIASTRRSRLAFNGCAATGSSCSRLAFGEVVPCQPAPPPVVRISRSMCSHVRRVHPVRVHYA